jgi:VanZ family protein
VTRIRLPLAPAWVRWAGVVAVASLIGYFSLLTTAPAPPEPGPIWDKKLHFAAYAGFAYSLAYATAESGSRPLIRGAGVLGAAVAFGLGVELAQGQLPMRYYSHGDLLANLIGAGLVLPWFGLERWVRYVRLRRLRALVSGV